MLPFEKVCFGTAAISQYSNATPSGSFSASQAAAASRLVKTLRCRPVRLCSRKQTRSFRALS
jgi:hypothetical protein